MHLYSNIDKVELACLAMLLIIFLGSASVAEQPASDPLLDHLVGTWVLHGTIEGKETTHDVTAQWILQQEYLEVHEVSREKDAKGQPAYEAMVLLEWNPKLNEYACQWLDTTGGGGLSGSGIGHGKRDGNQIAFLFKAGDGSLFHNTFVYSPANDTWHWVLDGEEKGKLQPFARLELKKK
jgi:hypothetical protein